MLMATHFSSQNRHKEIRILNSALLVGGREDHAIA